MRRHGPISGYNQPWVAIAAASITLLKRILVLLLVRLFVRLFVGGWIRSMRRLQWSPLCVSSLTSGFTIWSSNRCDCLIAVISEMSLSGLQLVPWLYQAVGPRRLTLAFLYHHFDELWSAFLGLMQDRKGLVFANTSLRFCCPWWQCACLRRSVPNVRRNTLSGRRPKGFARYSVDIIDRDLTGVGRFLLWFRFRDRATASSSDLLSWLPCHRLEEDRWVTNVVVGGDRAVGVADMQKVPQPSKPTWVSVQDVVLNSLRPSTQPSQLLPELSHFYQTHKHKERCLAHVAMVLVGVSRLDTKWCGVASWHLSVNFTKAITKTHVLTKSLYIKTWFVCLNKFECLKTVETFQAPKHDSWFLPQIY